MKGNRRFARQPVDDASTLPDRGEPMGLTGAPEVPGAPTAPTAPAPRNQTWAGSRGPSLGQAGSQTGDPWDAVAGARAELGHGALPTPAAPRPVLADAVRSAAANNYSDIAGAEQIGAGNYLGQLEGFGNIDPGGERGSNTHKKLFGRIASRYDVTQPDAVRRLMADPDFQAAFPDAQLVEHPNADLIDFGDGNPVDVIRGAVAGGSGEGWQWGVDAGGGDMGGFGGVDGLGGGYDLNSLLTGQTDPMADIMRRIQDLQAGNMPEAEREALLGLLNGA